MLAFGRQRERAGVQKMQDAFQRICGGGGGGDISAKVERACAPGIRKVQTAADDFLGQASDWLTRLPLGGLALSKKNSAATPATPASRARRASREFSDGDAGSFKSRLDLNALNPSLYVIGLDVVEQMMPWYIEKAGIACERMQHAQLPVDVIRKVLTALFVCPEGETQQPEDALRECFALFDASGDGSLDNDELLAVLPLLGEDVPETVVSKLFDAIDNDSGGTVDGAEFVAFMRTANPVTPDAPSGWRAFLPEAAAHFEEMVLLHFGTRHGRGRGAGQAWEPVQTSELEVVQRQVDAPYSMSLLLLRADLANCEALVAGLRELGWRDDEVRTVARALFVTNTDEDYLRVFQIFDRDNTGGIDPFEFRAIMSLLGDRSTEAEARQLFLDTDGDNDGVLDAAEFVGLLRQISPKASTASEAQIYREQMARERLQARLAEVNIARVSPEDVDAMVQVLVLGASHSGKTFLLNQVLADKLPKGHTVAVGVGALSLRIGHHEVAVQVLDTPGDPRFAPLAQIFYPSVQYVILLFDATTLESFEAVGPLLEAYRARNPTLDIPAHVCLVSNAARLGVKRAISSGFALEWCQEHGGIPFFEVDPEAPQGILEPLHHLADEYLIANPVGGFPAGGGGAGEGAGVWDGEPATRARPTPPTAAPSSQHSRPTPHGDAGDAGGAGGGHGGSRSILAASRGLAAASSPPGTRHVAFRSRNSHEDSFGRRS